MCRVRGRSTYNYGLLIHGTDVTIRTMDRLAFLLRMVVRCRQAASDLHECGAPKISVAAIRTPSIGFEVEAAALSQPSRWRSSGQTMSVHS